MLGEKDCNCSTSHNSSISVLFTSKHALLKVDVSLVVAVRIYSEFDFIFEIEIEVLFSEMSSDTVKRASGQRPKKRKNNRYYGNQHSTSKENDALHNVSASGKKLVCDYEVNSSDNFTGYTLIDKNMLFTALEQCLCCIICHNKITIDCERMYGLTEKITISCTSCGSLSVVKNSKLLGKNQNASDLNRRFILAMKCIGRGLADSKTFCGIMDLPPPVSQKAYDKIVSHIHAASNTVAENSMKTAANEETNMTGSSNLTVSGDGTWKTRGYSSRFGATSIIGSETGKVIDRYVTSSYCKGCESGKDIANKDNYLKWKKNHDEVCSKNHTGSSALMEVNGIVNMFSRSEEKYGVRYVNYIGDGDCKTFSSIASNNPYDTPVTKIECVGHIQKRMGSRLRKLKTEFRGKKLIDKKPLSGKGRLTDVLIDQLTTYYGNAIRKHSDNYREMQRAIWAIWYHKRSNDDEPTHYFCPSGTDSWCTYNRSLAAGTIKDFKHTKSIPVAVMDALKPIFKDLSHPDLLKRCLGGKTQNVNESLNALIWKLCPKTTNAARKIVEIAVNTAIANFNDGKQAVLSIMSELELTPGIDSQSYAKEADRMRIYYAEKKSLGNSLEARIAKRREKKKADELNKQREGLVYASGAF